MSERFRLDSALATIDDAVGALPRPVLLVGLSLGGYLALHYAGGPGRERVDGVLAAACGTSPRWAALMAYRSVAAAIGRLPDRGAALNQLLVDLTVPAATRDDVTAGGVALDVMADSLRELAPVRSLTDIARSTAPLLFVNGQFDHFRAEEHRYLRTARNRQTPASSDLIVIPRASHLVSLTQPESFNRVLLGAARVMALL